MPMLYKSHYAYLEENFDSMMLAVKEIEPDLRWKVGLDNICSDGDKCYRYMGDLELCKETGLHPFQISFLYLLSSWYPFVLECRQTPNGFVPVEDWILSAATRFRSVIAPAIAPTVRQP